MKPASRSLGCLRPLAFLAVALALLAFASTASLHAQADDKKPLDGPAVQEFEERFAEVWRKNDPARLKEFLGKDFMNVLPSGMLQSAEDLLDLVKKGTLAILEYRLQNVKIRVYGEMAVVTYVVYAKYKYEGEAHEGRFATTDVIIRTNGALKIVSSQSTEVSDE